MKEVLNYLKEKKELIVICVFVFLLPFDPDWSSKALIALSIISVISFKQPQKIGECRVYLVVLIITLIYIILNNVFYSEPISIKRISAVALFILFLIIFFKTKIRYLKLKNLTIAFVLGVLFVGLFNLIIFIIDSKSILILNAWIESSFFDIHKTYFGAFLNLSTLMLLYLKSKKNIQSKYILILTPIFFVLLIYTGSISNIFIFFLIIVLFLASKVNISLYKKLYLLIVFAPILILIGVSTDFGKSILFKIEGEGSRSRNYEVSISLIQRAPIFGYGIGRELDVLQKARKKKSWEYINEYNSHNQYFEYLIGGGFIYLVLSLYPIFIINFYSKYNFLANGFTLILTYLFLIESFHERHHGQIFYAFFASLIILELYNEKQNEPN